MGLAHPQFSFAHDRVDPFRGFIRPALRAIRVGVQHGLQPLFILETHAVTLQKAGPMKPLQEPTRSGNCKRYHGRALTQRGGLEKL